jgi:hypothetical protein
MKVYKPAKKSVKTEIPAVENTVQMALTQPINTSTGKSVVGNLRAKYPHLPQ